jgi:DNA-binding transcriptional LysR family regulator
VKLLVRTTRRITLTHEGSAFLKTASACWPTLAQCRGQRQRRRREGQRALAHHRAGRFRPPPRGPAGAGVHCLQHPEVSLSLNLSDRVVDIVNEGFDCAIRVGDLPDSSLVSVRLADNRRLCVAAPAYLQRAGVPARRRPT